MAKVTSNHKPGVLNGFENRPRPTNYNSNPLHWSKRHIKAMPGEGETNAHTLLAMKSLARKAGEDVRQQILCSDAAINNAIKNQIATARLRMEVQDKKAGALETRLLKMQVGCANSMRMAGLTTLDGKRAGGKDSASVFTQPRPRSDAERQAEQVA